MTDTIAVLLMAYGTPGSLEEIEPYYTDIRGGRKPSPENLKELVERYQTIGGKTPLLEITAQQARALQEQLGNGYRVYIGMKHWRPYIAQAVQEMVRDGLQRVVAVALAPHYSRFSIDGYLQRVREAVKQQNANLDMCFVESWNDHPLFIKAIAAKMEQARLKFSRPNWNDVHVVFSAHSLPERILQSHDPYPQELKETCQGVADSIGLKRWRFAYQSAGRTGEKWLGPELLDMLNEIAAESRLHQPRPQVLIAPIGFVADHLEVLYDIDVQAAERAQHLGLEMRRIESPNANPAFIDALAAVVKEASRGR